MVGTFCATCTATGYPSLFLFFTQNKVPKTIIGMKRKIISYRSPISRDSNDIKFPKNCSRIEKN